MSLFRFFAYSVVCCLALLGFFFLLLIFALGG